jgi:hypothetical protein
MSANDELQAHTCEKILQEYGNVANNVAQGNSQDLTEQWKKGELPYGNYYVKNIYGNVVNDIYRDNKYDEWILHSDKEICEVLAPVPSYEEWKQLHKFLEEFNALDVAKENQQLKELLKECRYNVATDLEDAIMCESNVDIEYFEYLLTRIDNAIGEKK